ncbi:MAG: hypothetical protein BGO67_02490 [Alphaproteobacteria bacterium 41-28]|nr:MAG: hypothetical protein BGO67_02490 [Alphaproteobacteria bacterium 41-28]
MKTNVGIFLFNGAEVLDFAGPFEVFTTATRLCEREGKERPFNVFTFAATKRNIVAREGLEVVPAYSLENVPSTDLVIIPGGVSDEPQGQKEVMDFLRKAAESKSETIASVCTGAFILAKAGILKGLKATTHWKHIKELKAIPDIDVVEGVTFVDQGKILTSAGVTSGIALSLYLVSRFVDEGLAELTAKEIEYPYPI